MPLNHLPDFFNLVGVRQWFQPDHFHVAAVGEILRLVQNISHPAAHASGEVAPCRAENHHPPAGHVFAAMIADGFDHGVHPGVADAESFARHAAKVGLAAGRAVERDVADNHVVLGFERRRFGRINNEFAAAQTFAEIIVGVTFEFKRHAARYEAAEALARAAVELELNRVFGQSVRPVLPGHFAAGDGADDAVDVADGQLGPHFFAALDGRLAKVQKLREVERLFQAVILILLTKAPNLRADFGLMQNRREIEAAGLPMLNRLPGD